MIKKETELEETLRKGILVNEAEGTMWAGWRLPETRKSVGIGKPALWTNRSLLGSPCRGLSFAASKLRHSRDRNILRLARSTNISRSAGG
jgi:hypothetical protein